MFAKKIIMQLIVDCGSTKADWVLLDGKNIVEEVKTNGFNPNYTEKEIISRITLDNNIYKLYNQDIINIEFYGSGCANDNNSNVIKEIFKSAFKKSEIHVHSDMMAVCHALLGHKQGIACILGTGSNACRYDGHKITDSVVSLGYIIGDEGSGSHLGKTLLRDYFYKKMPSDIKDKFENRFKIDINSFIDNAYHKNNVSRYFASFAVFAGENKEHEYIRNLCNKSFDEFIDNYIIQLKPKHKEEISFIGSVAYHLEDIIKERFNYKGLQIGIIKKTPMEGLVRFHSSI